ncbi:MAG: hypothetical protein LC732_05305, partial [Acidobacteria bacterium]|nr:hypothetical protein [Acidobacteriota bacterium]
RFLFVVLLLAFPLSAQVPAEVADRRTIVSEVLGEPRAFWVRVPDHYDRTTARYPVLILTDGDQQMQQTVSTVGFLEHHGRIPELLVIGITNSNRARDLTPSTASMTRWDGIEVPYPNSGGADLFLAFIETELIPWVDANYRTEPFRILAGHSFGGLFAVHAFVAKPSLFRGVIAASPILQWDDDLVVRKAVTLFDETKELPATVHLTMGREDETLVASVRRFQELAKTKSPEGLRVSVTFMKDEDHGSVALRSYYDGLRRIFAAWKPAVDENGQYKQPLKGLLNHYGRLSERYGYQVTPPEAVLNRFGYQRLILEGKVDDAIEALTMNVKNWPESANVYDSLGEAHEAKGELYAAQHLYRKAVEKSAGKNDPNEAAYRANLDRVNRILR